MSFDLNQNALMDYLTAHKFDPTIQKETEQVYVLTKIKELEVPIFFGIYEETAILQILAYLPYDIQEKAIGETARMLHFINKQIDMPFFGMDEKAKLMFYRCMLPCLNEQVNKELLGMHLQALKIACESFMFALGTIASGTKKVDEIIKNG